MNIKDWHTFLRVKLTQGLLSHKDVIGPDNVLNRLKTDQPIQNSDTG